MAASLDSCVGGRNSITNRESSIPIRSTYLQSSGLSDASIYTNRPSTSSSVNKRWKIDKLPTFLLGESLNPSTPESNWFLQSDPAWTRIPTEEPLSPGLRAEVREDLMKFWYFDEMAEFRRQIKWCWLKESCFLPIRGSIAQLESRPITQLCNKLTSFYWMPSAEFDGGPLPLLPFGCIFNEWMKYHDNRPNIDFWNFFANLVRVYPTDPTTVQGIVEAHKTLCKEAALLLERIYRGEAKEFLANCGSGWRQPQNYNLKPSYRAIITILDRFVEPGQEGDFTIITNLTEHSKNQTVLLVRTGDESHLSAPINFETLRANGLCLPLGRTDVPATSGDVVRVSLANAVKFVLDLQQREDTTFPHPRATLEMERKAKEWADRELKEADDKGIDNVFTTWTAVRSVKATRMGETFHELEPFPSNRNWRFHDTVE